MNILTRSLIVLGTCLALYGCAGPAPAIQHRFPMEMLNNSPPEVRAPVADAYNAHYEAKLKLAHMEFMLKDVEYDFRMAKAEKKMAKQKMQMEKIKTERNKFAFKTKLMDAAKSAMLGFGSRSTAMNDKLRYLKSQQKYLRKGVLHARANVDHTEARFELAKAKLAQERKTIPKGFKLEKFIKQEKRTAKIANKKSQKTKSAESDAKSKLRIWNKVNKPAGAKVPSKSSK
jgi:hypothetical protein